MLQETATLASSETEHTNSLILKRDESFAIFEPRGNINSAFEPEEGAFHEGTRFLSRWEISLGRAQPLMLLSSGVRRDNTILSVDLTNPTLRDAGLEHGVLHIRREIILWNETLYERVHFWNLGLEPLMIRCVFYFGADFIDIFELRGVRRTRRGTAVEPVVSERGAILAYRGLDGIERRTIIRFGSETTRHDQETAEFEVSLQSQQSAFLDLSASFEIGDVSHEPVRYEEACEAAQSSHRMHALQQSSVSTSNEQCNQWIRRSRLDLQMLLSRTPHGEYPYAGVPWFSTAFGRDGIITAMQLLAFYPQLARNVLSYLAATQADSLDEPSNAEPGKIIHESRRGEMAALGEVPFRRYYGTIDATPLFIVLAGQYLVRTGDNSFLNALWPHIERALDWMDNYGDIDGDGFLEYRSNQVGLINQAWMDSDDAVYHHDGSFPAGPIAMCEVQAYAYAAKLAAAGMSRMLGKEEQAVKLEAEAAELRRRFDEFFWIPELGEYALALDGEKSPCRIRGSNVGHCLTMGIVEPNRADSVVRQLFDSRSFSGWGIRTKASGQVRFSPLAYHNGSIWPHDTAFIALGCAKYGFVREASKIFSALFDASTWFHLNRLPELFCGFDRVEDLGPTLYPVACSPQAWAAGAVFMLLSTAMGLTVEGGRQKLKFENPYMPDFLDEITINRLSVGSADVDLLLKRQADTAEVLISVRPRRGSVRVSIIRSASDNAFETTPLR